MRESVQVTTPLGHQYESEPPPLLGWGSAETWQAAAVGNQSTPNTTARAENPEPTRDSARREDRQLAERLRGRATP